MLDNDTFGGSIGGCFPPSGTYTYPGTAPVPVPTACSVCPKCSSMVYGPLASHFCLPMQGSTATLNGYTCSKCNAHVLWGAYHVCAYPKKTTDIFFDVKIDCDEERLDRLLEKLERLAELREKLKT